MVVHGRSLSQTGAESVAETNVAAQSPASAASPENIFARFRRQMDVTSGNRIRTPAKGKLTRANLRRGLFMGWNIIRQIGAESDYRAVFWRSAWHTPKKSRVEAIYNMGFVCHHLITFTREALRGEHNASFYAAKKAGVEEGVMGLGVGAEEAA